MNKLCEGGDGFCTRSAEADGFCDEHHPGPRPPPSPEFVPVKIVQTFERQGDFDVWGVYLEDADGHRIIRWRESLQAGSRQSPRDAMGRHQDFTAWELAEKFKVAEIVEEYRVPE